MYPNPFHKIDIKFFSNYTYDILTSDWEALTMTSTESGGILLKTALAADNFLDAEREKITTS